MPFLLSSALDGPLFCTKKHFLLESGNPGAGQGLPGTSLSVSVQQSPLRETGPSEVSEECCPAVREDEG